MFFCELCKISCCSKFNFDQHIVGYLHIGNEKRSKISSLNISQYGEINKCQAWSKNKRNFDEASYIENSNQNFDYLSGNFKMYTSTIRIFTIPEVFKDILKKNQGANLSIGTDNLVTFRFNYDPVAIEAVKTIAGRQYDKLSRSWKCPIESFPECLRLFQFMGGNLSKEIIVIAKELCHQAERDEVTAINLLFQIVDIMKADSNEFSLFDLVLRTQNFGHIVITFIYNTKIVQTLKQIHPDLRTYNSITKEWTINILATADLCEYLIDIDYVVGPLLGQMAQQCDQYTKLLRTIHEIVPILRKHINSAHKIVSEFSCMQLTIVQDMVIRLISLFQVEIKEIFQHSSDELSRSKRLKIVPISHPVTPAVDPLTPAASNPTTESFSVLLDQLLCTVSNIISALAACDDPSEDPPLPPTAPCSPPLPAQAPPLKPVPPAPVSSSRRSLVADYTSPSAPPLPPSLPPTSTTVLATHRVLASLPPLPVAVASVHQPARAVRKPEVDPDCDCGDNGRLRWGMRRHVCKYFGHFACHRCGQRWTSAHCWRGESQECRNCDTANQPVTTEMLQRTKGKGGKRDHDFERCSMCSKLGFRCSNGREYGDG